MAGMLGQGIIIPNGSLLGLDMGLDMNTISPGSQSSNISNFDDLSGAQTLFPAPCSFTSEPIDQPATSKGKEPETPTNRGSMSTADMLKAISDLEQPKRPLPGTRHYGCDAAM